MVEVLVDTLDRRLARFKKPLRRVAQGVFKFRDISSGAVEIYLVNSLQMKRLNFKYRNKNKPTDVLAVESPDFPEVDKKSFGEIYINPASLKDKPYNIEYALIHGILHLLGFTHAGISDKMEMEKEEKKILKWLEHTS